MFTKSEKITFLVFVILAIVVLIYSGITAKNNFNDGWCSDCHSPMYEDGDVSLITRWKCYECGKTVLYGTGR